MMNGFSKPEPLATGTESGTYMPIAGAMPDGAGMDIRLAPLKGARLPSLPSSVAIGDWDDLLGAVKERLRLIVGDVRAATVEPPQRDTVAWVQDGVLECVAALDQLHTTLASELARSRHRE